MIACVMKSPAFKMFEIEWNVVVWQSWELNFQAIELSAI